MKDTIQMDASESEIELGEVFATLWRAKWLIGICTAVMLVLAVYYLVELAENEYTATSIVALENREDQVTDLESVIAGMSSDQATINTEIEVLRSRQLIGRLVDDLALTEDPLFNTRLRPEPIINTRRILDIVLNRPEPAELNEDQIRALAVDQVLQRLSVTNIRDSYVFRITVRTDLPGKSADIANSIAELYIGDQLRNKFEATEDAISFLSDRSAVLQGQLEQAETAVKDFGANNDLVTRETLALKNRQLAELRDRELASETELAVVRQDIADLGQVIEAENPASLLETLDQPELLALAGRVSSGQLSLDAFRASVSRTLVSLSIAETRGVAQIGVLQDSVERLLADIQQESANLLTFEQLQREAEASRLLYEYFLSRLKEASVQQGIQQADARVLSEAAIPRSPSSPRRGMVLGLAGVLGVLFGATIAIIRELRQNTFRNSEDLERITARAVVGQIPKSKLRNRKDLLKDLKEKPNSPFSEAVRDLRTSILMSNVDNPPQVMMLTSSLPAEGKTTVALSLSLNFAGLNKRVLLIEADIRRRTFDQYFQTENKRSLVEAVMSDDVEMAFSDEASLSGVDVLFGGRATINAADFFSSERFEAFIAKMRKVYDYIIIDTPPVLLVPDARIIGRHADSILYCVHWDKTSKTQVKTGLRSFDAINLPVAGTVMSQIDPAGMRRYGYSGKYGSYANYGKSYYDH